jgi:surfeit locus 1 family protein
MAKVKSPDRFPIGLTITTIIALAILVGLGVWQLKRLTWKTNLLAEVAAAQTMDAVPLAQALALPMPDFHRVSLTCTGLATADFVTVHAIVDASGGAQGTQGRRLMSPCSLDGAQTVLVDRGFIADETAANPPVAASTTPVALTGVLTRGGSGTFLTPPPTGRLFFARDLPAMAKALGINANPTFFVAAETQTNPDFPALKPVSLPPDIPNNHFQYALTWFGLAAALFAIYAAKLLPWLRTRFRF